MTKTIQLTDTMFTVGRKLHDTKGYKKWVNAMAIATGESVKDITVALEARIATATIEEARAKLNQDVKTLKLNDTIRKLAKLAAADGFFLAITCDSEGNVTTTVAKNRKGRASNGEVSPTSRISAAVACKRGIAAGDTFKVAKADKGYHVDGRFVASRANGGLAAFILKTHPASKTAAILTQYGYTL